jgi:hypothetical protein
MYNALESPLEHDGSELSATVGAFLVRIGYEQFPYQLSYFEEMSRLGALFANVASLPTEVLNADLIERLLGCSLSDFVGAGFVISVGARANNGLFDPEWRSLWEGPDAINQHLSMETVRRVFHSQFVTTVQDVRAASEEFQQSDPKLRAHEFNPLVNRPFVTLPDGRYLAPQPHYAFQRITPSAVYYAGVDSLAKDDKDAFTRDFGVVFQDYVGHQLRLMPDADVISEIAFDSSQRSVDWFVVFHEVVLLVEAKSTRLSHLGRMGGNRLKDDIERSIGKAFRQIARTEELLTTGHPAFAEIPKDRPRIGLIATLEPYWAANTPFLAPLLPEPALFTTVASMRAIEQLVGTVRHLGHPQPLLDLVNDPDRRTWNLENALPRMDLPKNPLLLEAWDGYPFPNEADDAVAN